MSTMVEKSSKILTFSGKTEDWNEWSEKFQGIALRDNYDGTIQGEEVPVLDTEAKAASSADGKPLTAEQKRIREANQKAYIKHATLYYRRGIWIGAEFQDRGLGQGRFSLGLEAFEREVRAQGLFLKDGGEEAVQQRSTKGQGRP